MYKQPKDVVLPLKSLSAIPQPFQDFLHPFVLPVSAYLSLQSCVETEAVKHAVSQAATVTTISLKRLFVYCINKLMSHKNSSLKINNFLK